MGGHGSNPFAAVDPPRPLTPEPRIPAVEETRTIIEATKGSIVAGPTILAVGCGLRLGEALALALQYRDVDLGRGRISVNATLYRDGRTSP